MRLTNTAQVTRVRRIALAALIAGTTIASTGCSSGGFSIASMNPFAKSSGTVEQPDAAPGVSDRLASAAGSAKEGVTTFGASTRSAVSKTTAAIAGVFRRPTAEGTQEADELSLANKPDKISADVYIANGQLWESSGELTKAMESYTKALESEPENAPALASVARLHYRQGKYQQANEYFGRALKQNPSDAELLNDLGLTLSKLNDTAGAIASFDKALKLVPKTSRYANNLATVHFESGNPSAAYQVLAANNKPAVAHFNMAYLYFKGGQMNEAKQHLNSAVEFQPQAAGDEIVKRAVDRSREMLAQIDSSTAPIAQAAPQATIAGGQFFNGPQTAPVQQTARKVLPSAPAAASGPAAQAITPPAAATAPAMPATGTDLPATTAPPSTYQMPSWNQPTASPAPSSIPSASVSTSPAAAKPTRPAAPATSTGEGGLGDGGAVEGAADGPSYPFALPEGFQPEN